MDSNRRLEVPCKTPILLPERRMMSFGLQTIYKEAKPSVGDLSDV